MRPSEEMGSKGHACGAVESPGSPRACEPQPVPVSPAAPAGAPLGLPGSFLAEVEPGTSEWGQGAEAVSSD